MKIHFGGLAYQYFLYQVELVVRSKIGINVLILFQRMTIRGCGCDT